MIAADGVSSCWFRFLYCGRHSSGKILFCQSLMVLSSYGDLLCYAAWDILPVHLQRNLSEFQMVKFLTYILLQMTRKMNSLLNSFIYHLYTVPLHYTHLKQLIILITTDVLVMTHTCRLIPVSPSLLQSGLRSMVGLFHCHMLFISPLYNTNSTNVLCNYLTLLYLSPSNFFNISTLLILKLPDSQCCMTRNSATAQE
jgi:hypothetical protein